ncbi:MAG: hypothetical protein LKM30_08320 [Bacilli bacterium]|jgi:NitT/TauT family transport system substrate-binding protein|nr:hypothetical protein [Bacilli bacterium]
MKTLKSTVGMVLLAALLSGCNQPTSASVAASTSTSPSVASASASASASVVSTRDSSADLKEADLKIVAPQGAPAAALAGFAGTSTSPNPNLTLQSASLMTGEFSKGTADFIIFDSVNGLKLSAKNNNNYQLARMVTFGNLYLIATGNDTNGTFDKTDFTIGYGQGLLPDLAFKAVYPEGDSKAGDSTVAGDTGAYIDGYVPAVSDTAAVLVSGKFNAVNVDYVVSSYPVVLSAMGKNAKLSVKENISASFGTKYSTSGFPQAALFVKTASASDVTRQSAITSFLTDFDSAVTDLATNNGTAMVKAMSDYSSDATEQGKYFGFNQSVLTGCQANGKNALAFITKDKNPNLTEFAKFQTPLGFTVSASQLSSYYPL